MLEIIGINLQDIKDINKTEADQIEYCIDMQFDGLTPSIKDIENISLIDNTQKIRIMLREHHDSFLINKSQLDKLLVIISQINNFSNIDGYVFGAITKQKEIDFESLEIILKSIKNKNLTFHKAFDLVENKSEQLAKLMKYDNVKYVLTSGGIGTPLDNLEFFKQIPNKFKNRILVGGGVNKRVIKTLKPLGFTNFHVGSFVRENQNYSSKVSFNKINELKSIINLSN